MVSFRQTKAMLTPNQETIGKLQGILDPHSANIFLTLAK